MQGVQIKSRSRSLDPDFFDARGSSSGCIVQPDNAMGGVPWLHLTGVLKANGSRTAIARLVVPALSMPRRLTAPAKAWSACGLPKDTPKAASPTGLFSPRPLICPARYL